MDRRRASCSCSLLLIFFILSSHSKVILGNTSVLFLHGSTRQYIRQPSAQTNSLSPSEFGVVASVLLGFAPPASLSAASSSKLNEVLMPNPFDRPRAMLILEVVGSEDFPLNGGSDKSPFNSAVRINVEGDQNVDMHLKDEDEVYIVSLNELETATQFSDKEISEFASWLGGSYIEHSSKPLCGDLIIPAPDGAILKLHMEEGADKEFTTGLVSLINSIKSAKGTHQVLSKSSYSPAELIHGRFHGVKALQSRYGKEGTAQIGLDVFATAISKAFNSLESAYDGKIVGVIGLSFQPVSKMESIFHVPSTSHALARALQETELPPDPSEVAEVLFVRTTLAWITGVILLIATLLGVLYLLNMPLTKDTLLYSNVKLD